MKLILNLFAGFRFARKRLGGTWYYIEDSSAAGGLEGPLRYWTKQRPEEDQDILKEENYTAT